MSRTTGCLGKRSTHLRPEAFRLPRSLVCLLFLVAAGCGKSDPVGGGDATAAPPVVPSAGDTAAPATPRKVQSFDEATVDFQSDWTPPEETLSHKSVGKLFEEVRNSWDKVPVVDANGRPLPYVATLDTDLGPIEIELRADLAPNHVRNFVALIRAGYYDGLVFERVVRQQAEDNPDNKVEIIEAGCPIGRGEEHDGSIGYWLNPEFSPAVKHEIGVVGACLGNEPDSAACRFYICLSKAPVLDGERTIFGKVRAGLDVAHRIATQPIANTPEYPSADRPEKPIVIRKATVTLPSTEKPAKGG